MGVCRVYGYTPAHTTPYFFTINYLTVRFITNKRIYVEVGIMKINWKVWLYLALSLLSLIMVGIQFVIYRDLSLLSHDLFFAISILPFQVGMTALILDQLLERRVQQERLEKMNMVIGVFFSEMGVDLLRKVSAQHDDIDTINKNLIINNNWTQDDFLKVMKTLADHQYKVDMDKEDLIETKNILSRHRSLIVQLLENPILLEHETFTNTLRAIFHLTEELYHRKSLSTIPNSDLEHLNGDTARAYGLLINEWVRYMAYLKNSYPYLFS